MPVAPELLAVLQGSRWLENDTDSLVSDIQQIVSEWGSQDTTSDRLLSMAAALRPSLVAPSTGLVSSLPQGNEINLALGKLADAIRTFGSGGHPLRIEDLKPIESREAREEQIREIGKQARCFLGNQKHRKLKFKGATAVLQRLVLPRGDLHLLLTPVIENKTDQITQVQQCINDLDDHRKIQELITRTDQGQEPRRSKPITEIPSINWYALSKRPSISPVIGIT